MHNVWQFSPLADEFDLILCENVLPSLLLFLVDGMKEVCIDDVPRDWLMGELVCWLRRLCLQMLFLSCEEVGVGLEVLINLVLLLFLLEELLPLKRLSFFHGLRILLVPFRVELSRDWIRLEFAVQLTYYLSFLLLVPLSGSSLHYGLLLLC